MTNKKPKLFDFFTKLKKGIFSFEKIGLDYKSTPSTEESTRELKEEEKIELTPYQRYVEFEKQNKENYKEFSYQDENSIMLKLNRPFAREDFVILLKDYPNHNLYRGYLCIILDIFYDYSYPFENNAAHDYEIIFSSKNIFGEKEQLPVDSECICTIPGRDLLRIETLDLRYRTNFPKMF